MDLALNGAWIVFFAGLGSGMVAASGLLLLRWFRKRVRLKRLNAALAANIATLKANTDALKRNCNSIRQLNDQLKREIERTKLELAEVDVHRRLIARRTKPLVHGCPRRHAPAWRTASLRRRTPSFQARRRC
jgi:hypothetical protein